MAKKNRNAVIDHKVVTLEIEDPDGKERNRLVSLDLDDEDDWGELETGSTMTGRRGPRSAARRATAGPLPAPLR